MTLEELNASIASVSEHIDSLSQRLAVMEQHGVTLGRVKLRLELITALSTRVQLIEQKLSLQGALPEGYPLG